MVMTMTVNEIGEYSHSKPNSHTGALRNSFLSFRFTLCHYEKSFAFISYGPNTALRVRRCQNNTNRPNPNQSNQSITTFTQHLPRTRQESPQGKKSEGKEKRIAQAKAPTNAIPNAPAITYIHAIIRFFPVNTRQLSSLRKSSARSSTRPANTSRPDEIAFIIPTIKRPVWLLGEYRV